MMKQKAMSIILIVLCLLITDSPALAAGPVIAFNGEPASWSQEAYFDSSTGNTMVPVRAFCEAVGATVTWRREEAVIEVQMNGRTSLIRDYTNKDGVTYAPLRQVALQLGLQVQWKAEQGIADVRSDMRIQAPLFFNPASARSPRSDAAKSMIRQADKLLNAEPLSVTQKTSLLPGADPHDFVSMAIYYWPDPGKPDQLPYVSKDGLVNPEKDSDALYDAHRKDKMTNTVQVLSFAYWLTENEKYAAKAAELLRVWFLDENTKMNPNFNHAQLIPGKNDGSSTGQIDAVTNIALLDAVRLLESSSSWTPEDDAGLKSWFSQFADWQLTSSFGKKERAAKNNHGVWYHAQLADYLWFAGRDDEARMIVREGQKLIQNQIQPDGSMPLELSRTRSMHYTVYNLEAFITLARVGELTGEELFHYETAEHVGIREAIDYLLPYLLGEQTWGHEQIVRENESGFAPYLLAAANVYDSSRYREAAAAVLGADTGKAAFIAGTLR